MDKFLQSLLPNFSAAGFSIYLNQSYAANEAVQTAKEVLSCSVPGAKILMECLVEQGVDTIFGYPGGTILNVYDELYNYEVTGASSTF